ncbi:putative mariner transposase [Trichonephila clavipes]|nr:putative mariner transposase [Trichonephila clavipes]
MSKSKLKAMLVFYYIHGIVYFTKFPEDQTVNQHYYLPLLAELHTKIRKKRSKLWKDKSSVLHKDYAPVHSALSVKRFLGKYCILVLYHPVYSLDLAP